MFKNRFLAAGIGNDIMTYINLWNEKYPDFKWDNPIPKPFKGLLLTPSNLKINDVNLAVLREMKEKKEIETIMLDSGGYQIYKGNFRHTFESLLEANVGYYNDFDWADGYFLQDKPPQHYFSYDEIQENIDKSIEASYELYNLLSDTVKKKAIAILHCVHLGQVEQQLTAYKEIIEANPMRIIAFPRVVSPIGQVNRNLNSFLVLERIQKENVGVHYLGVGKASLIFLLQYLNLGIISYDNSSWVIGAGYGRLIFPYLSVKFFHEATDKKDSDNCIKNQRDLDELKEKMNHKCPFCESFEEAKDSRAYRLLHNLVVYSELPYIFENDKDPIKKLKEFAPDSYKLYTQYQEKISLPLFA